jgi:hypothetical protein
MTPKSQRAASAIALLLVFSLAQVYVQANLATKSAAAKAEAATLARTGKLVTRGNSAISLNGNRTVSGTTVLSGSELQTPAGVGASVQLGRNGHLTLAPETSLTLDYDDTSIDVTLSSGYATLTTNEGIRGSITMPDGKTVRNDVSKLSTIEGPSAATEDSDDTALEADGDTALFEAAVEPGQSSAKERAEAARARRNLQACMRPAQNAYQRAVKDAKEARRKALAKAEGAFRQAMKSAKTEAERDAARLAKRKAQMEANDAYKDAVREAQRVREEALRKCKNPNPPPDNTPEPEKFKSLENGVGVLGNISNGSARTFGLATLGSAIAATLIVINLEDTQPVKAINPSPSTP